MQAFMMWSMQTFMFSTDDSRRLTGDIARQQTTADDRNVHDNHPFNTKAEGESRVFVTWVVPQVENRVDESAEVKYDRRAHGRPKTVLST